MAIWDDVIPESDRARFVKGGMGGNIEWGARPGIVIIDMGYGFVDSRYPMGCSETGQPAAAAIRRLLDVARPRGVPVIYTTAPISKIPCEKGLWKNSGNDFQNAPSDPGLPDQAEIAAEIAPQEDEPVIYKVRPSGFFGTNLVDMLIYHRVDTLIVTGMTTSGCVRATVVDGFSYNYRTVIPLECVADRSTISHKVTLFDLHMKYADVAPLGQVIEYLTGLPSGS